MVGTLSLALAPVIQTLVVDTARNAPMLAAAAMQSAFNLSNAVGAAVAGLVLATGWGYSAPPAAGAGARRGGGGHRRAGGVAGAERAVPRRWVAGAAGADILPRVDDVVELALVGAGRMGACTCARSTLREGGRRRSG